MLKIIFPEIGEEEVMVVNATFINISVISLRTVFNCGGNRRNRRSVGSHDKYYKVVSSIPIHERDSNLEVIDADCTNSVKSNYHTITTTTAFGDWPCI